jgi:hypothetical protein
MRLVFSEELSEARMPLTTTVAAVSAGAVAAALAAASWGLADLG